MNDVGVIDRFLSVFTSYIDSGFGLLGGEIAFLTTTLIVIDITLAGLFWAWGADEDVLQRLVKKTLYIGFFAFIIGNFNWLANIVFESFSGLGLQAGGGSLSGSELLQPGRVAQVGIDAGNPILEAAGDLMGYLSFFENLVQIVVLMTAWAIVLIAFFVLAIQIFVTLIEFKLTTLAGFVLIPFALFGKTAFLAEKVLGNIVASGVKILVLAVIVGIGSGLFGEFTSGFPPEPTITDAMSLALGALALMGLSIFGPGIATGLVSGAPQLGAGAAVGTGLAVAGMGAAGYMGARAAAGGGAAAIGAGGRMSAAAARGGAHLAGSTSAAYGLAASTSGQSGMGAVAAGLGGVAKAGASAAAQPARQAMSRAADAMRSSFRSGQAGAWTATGGQSQVAGMASGAGSAAESAAPSGQPAWAARMKRGQTISHGTTAAAHAVRSGDSGGGSMNVSLNQDDRG
ncbi:P-type conjugative transfer protein TrbL [Neoaquamicrobium sediminum]|uniref:P-type conjugative transfer protein TrbL n=1 Tax=Neoaquamicrobium sediminum TaxID=1849104 RepID=UPI003BAAE7E8